MQRNLKNQPMNLVEEQALERRERILQTVRECIATQGVINLTIRDLARACRVSVPTLYRGFGSKEQLLVAAIRSYFDSDVLGEQLDNTGLVGAAKLLAIVDLCSRTMEDLPEYNRQLFALFMNSDYGGQLGWEITEAINRAVHGALLEIRANDEMESWVDSRALSERIGAQCVMTVMEFCNDDLALENFAPTFSYSTALLLMSVTRGKSQAQFKKRARKTQKLARRQHNTRLDRQPWQ